MMPTVLSYATADAAHTIGGADQLVRTCDRLGVQHRVSVLPPWSDRGGHCCHKPDYVLGRQDGQIVLWLDADTLLLDRPHVPDGRGWDVGTVRNPFEHSHLSISSAVIVFRPTDGARRVLYCWSALCRARRWGTRPHDHARLERVLADTTATVIDLTEALAPTVELYARRGQTRRRLPAGA